MTIKNVNATVTGGGATAQGSATFEVTSSSSSPPAQVPVNFGESSVLAVDDSGNANFLIAQKVTTTAAGVLQSISFYVGTVAGQLRLGLYNAAGPSGGPGALIAQTAAFTPVVGWNTKTLTATTLPVADYWMAYTPSSNGLHFRSNSGGGLRHVARTFQAMPATFSTTPLTTWDGSHFSFYMTLMVDQSTLPPAGSISYFNSAAANWSDPSIIDGKSWYNHHGGRPYSVTKVDNFTLRMEIRQGDPQAIDVGGERSEVSSGFGWAAPADVINIEYVVTLEAGASLATPKASWVTLMQIHGDSRLCIVFMDRDTMVVSANVDSSAAQQFEWWDSAVMVRGRAYKMRFQIKRGNAGFFKFWRDDVLLLDRNNVFVAGTDNYLKLGVYRGDPGSVPQTMAVRYANIKVS